MTRSVMVTGAAGFIGANFVYHWIQAHPNDTVVAYDALTYAGNRASLAPLEAAGQLHFVQGDICDSMLVHKTLANYDVDTLVHFAAESHVDRSITGPDAFIKTNLVGTHTLLAAARAHWLTGSGRPHRFHHVSTDEVYGSLGDSGLFSETTAYSPNSPYSASKAASDHLVRAWHHTYGLPTLLTNCSNNYGPCQFPEKLIPLVIANAVAGKPLPVYGDGANVRDWLYVDDHARALRLVLERGVPGQTYNIGGNAERRNLEVVERICAILDARRPSSAPHARLIEFVRDRPGHDRRYAIDSRKIERELGWTPQETFDSGLIKTVDWYLGNADWVRCVQSGEYQRWIERNYTAR